MEFLKASLQAIVSVNADVTETKANKLVLKVHSQTLYGP